jgi:hypothetical protein
MYIRWNGSGFRYHDNDDLLIGLSPFELLHIFKVGTAQSLDWQDIGDLVKKNGDYSIQFLDV